MFFRKLKFNEVAVDKSYYSATLSTIFLRPLPTQRLIVGADCIAKQFLIQIICAVCGRNINNQTMIIVNCSIFIRDFAQLVIRKSSAGKPGG